MKAKHITKYQLKMRQLRRQGYVAAMEHQPIESFPGGGERARSSWEIGWRAAKEDRLAGLPYQLPYTCPMCNAEHPFGCCAKDSRD